MNRLKNWIIKLTTPKHLSKQNGIHFWQEKVLLGLLLVASILGFFTWLPSVALSIREQLWIIAVIDTLTLGFVLTLFLRPDLSYSFRASSICAISYLLGILLITVLGPFGAGPVWLFFFPIIAGVLLGLKPASWALAINAATIIIIGFLIHTNLTDILIKFNFKIWYLEINNPLEKWVVVCINFMFLNTLATVSVTMVLNGLHASLQELGMSEKKHRQIFENILDVYFETTIDGTIIEISPSVKQMSGYTQDKLKGISIENLYKDPDKRTDLIQKLTKDGIVHDHEIQLKNDTGRIHTCSVNARLIKDRKGNHQRIIGILRDVSEQKAIAKTQKDLEERLNRAKKMEALGLLAGGVAHDLNNIFSGIVTYPELLLMDLPENSPMAEPLEIIHASGLRATQIVQDLLTLSRRGVMTRQVVDLNKIVSSFLQTPEYEKILSFHPCVRVKTDLSARHPLLKGSAIHLQKTLMNLLSNAAEAQPDGGLIQVSTADRDLKEPVKGYDQVLPGKYIVLSVDDQGMGIDPKDLKQIFEPFFTKKVMGRSGTGLGMAVVWGTVQDHGGYIDVISAQNKGTRFDLYFPITTEIMADQKEPLSLDRLKGQQEKILIIDDVADQRRIATAALEKLGYLPMSVASGEQAIQYLKTCDADLLILDMIMDPGIDGFETFKRILKFKPGQKAIIASGFSRTSQVDKTMALGAGQYIKKPYTIEQIGLAVQKELAAKR